MERDLLGVKAEVLQLVFFACLEPALRNFNENSVEQRTPIM